VLTTLPDPIAASLFTVFAWWFSTGLILILVRLPKTIQTLGFYGFSAMTAASVWAAWQLGDQNSSEGAYWSFVSGLVIWGWHEASFLMGKIMGPRPLPCPPGAVGYERFSAATATVLHHEIALFSTLLILLALTWGSPNQMAAWTFTLLFVMRLSAKFNMFLGVPNISHEFFPPHLEHLKTYLPKKRMNGLMPFSLLISLAVALWLMFEAGKSSDGTALKTGLVILSAMTALGLLEHVFMIAPLRDTALWRWAVPTRNPKPTSEPLPKGMPGLNETNNV
jgi:putative photosynthetic complex assembly protein 2